MPTLFTDVLRQARKGIVAQELTDVLADVTKTCIEHGKSGSVTLKIKITPEKGSDRERESGSGVVDLDFDISTSKPRRSLPKSPFYVDGEGGLHRSDPNQGEMFEDANGRRPSVRPV